MTAIPSKWQLAFLPLDSDEGRNYMMEMQHCVDFAFASRKLMMDSVKKCISDVVGEIAFGEMINVSHNHAIMEHHFGKNVMVHRKGATKAYKGQLGIIPGSQGTASYIVSGKGEPESFMSCALNPNIRTTLLGGICIQKLVLMENANERKKKGTFG